MRCLLVVHGLGVTGVISTAPSSSVDVAIRDGVALELDGGSTCLVVTVLVTCFEWELLILYVLVVTQSS